MGELEEGEGEDDAAPMLQFKGGRNAGNIKRTTAVLKAQVQVVEALMREGGGIVLFQMHWL
jgi:fructose-1,6-bisphosphatase/sedoheptulose 1,7-bisphosphatase-like protein